MRERGYSTAIVLMLVPVLTLGGCGAPPEADIPAAVRPVKTIVVPGDGGTGVRSFPARIEASRRAELSFRLNGRVQEIAVKEGDRITQGQKLARLDATDYQLTLNDRKAQFDNAKRNFDRSKGLVDKGAISKVDFDRMEAQYKSTEAAFEQAKQNVAYATLTAPFAGIIAKRHVESFEEVQAKQTVLTLQDPSTLDVKINLPEVLVRSLRADARDAAVPATARFEGVDRHFELTRKEVSPAADPKTQTFEATFTMPRPEQLMLLPGMTATVEIDLSAVTDAPKVHWVPATAIVAKPDLSPRVWIVNADGTVSGRDIAVGRMDSDRIEVLDGLDGGERIVAVGAGYLAEGMRVTAMAQTEQAQPRTDESL